MADKIVDILNKEGVGVLPTDTLYGLAGQALSQKAVEKIYKIKKRASNKPFIILISSIKDLALFKVKIDEKDSNILEKYWPGKVSVILPCGEEKFSYLHRGTNALAFRLPDKKELIDILEETGPLVAPSANLEGEKPATTIEEAKKYFGKDIDFYLDEGILESPPSTLIKITDENIEVLRKGAVYPIEFDRNTA